MCKLHHFRFCSKLEKRLEALLLMTPTLLTKWHKLHIQKCFLKRKKKKRLSNVNLFALTHTRNFIMYCTPLKENFILMEVNQRFGFPVDYWP